MKKTTVARPAAQSVMSKRTRQPTLSVFLTTGATKTNATAPLPASASTRKATVGSPRTSLTSTTSPAHSHMATSHDVTLSDDDDDDDDVRVEEAEESVEGGIDGANAAVEEFAISVSTSVSDVAVGDVDGTPEGEADLAWSCNVCTFLNLNAEAPVCEVCYSPRDPVVTTAGLDNGVEGVAHGASVVAQSVRIKNRCDAEDDTATLSTTGTHARLAAAGPSSDSVNTTPGVSDGASNHKRPRLIGAFGGSLLPPTTHISGSSLCGAAVRLEPTPNPAVDGLYIIHDFIDETTEAALVEWIDKGDAEHPWRRSRFNGKYMVKTWGVRTDLGTGTVRLPIGDEPVFPPHGGQMDVVIDNLRRIDFGRLSRKAQGW